MTERPAKLPAMALNVVWGCSVLTLGEAVVFYHDWALDQGGPDGSYISHESMAARLGDKLTAATVSKIRQRLKRLTLHEPMRRRDARNLGWVSTLPPQCVPRTYRDVPACAAALAAYLKSLTAWSEQSGRERLPEVDRGVQTGQSLQSAVRAAALGGKGDESLLSRKREAQLPPAVTEKGVGAHAPEAGEESQIVERRAIDERPRQEVEDEGFTRLRDLVAATQRRIEAEKRRQAGAA